MFEKIINSKLFQYIMTITIAILTVILTQGLVAKRDVAKSIKDEIARKATYEYVDTQDNNITKSVQQHIEDDRAKDGTMIKLIESMDRKIDILIANKR